MGSAALSVSTKLASDPANPRLVAKNPNAKHALAFHNKNTAFDDVEVEEEDIVSEFLKRKESFFLMGYEDWEDCGIGCCCCSK
jgi:CO dehydrogenase nickel-insertion accessory protein CooC1